MLFVMPMSLNFQETSALYGMLAEGGPDIVLKIAPDGSILDASPTISRLLPRCEAASDAMDLNSAGHLMDLVAPSHRSIVGNSVARALAGQDEGWIEFPAITSDARELWFEIKSRALRDEHGHVYEALAIMRSIDERRDLKQKLFAATYSDGLTGLTNRPAFLAMLQTMIDESMEGCVALFSIDFFMAINMKYGQHKGDDVLRVFADLLRETVRAEDIIARIGSERFAVLLPRTKPDQAETICSRVLSTLAGLRHNAGDDSFTLTASGSVARIADSLDSTMERGEMALFSARAKGRNRLEMERPRPVPMH